jgi:hypothetical protein
MGFFLRVGSIYLLKEKAQTSMEQDGSGCIGVVAMRVKQTIGKVSFCFKKGNLLDNFQQKIRKMNIK